MKVYFNQIFLLGLYAYLRQIELSLDRVSKECWQELNSYFDNRISPKKVLAYIEAHIIYKYKLSVNPYNKNFNIQLFTKLKIIVRKVFTKDAYLFENEISDIYYNLTTFYNLLKEKKVSNKETLNQLRMQLNSNCTTIALRLPKMDVEKAQYVEHFNQNKKLNCFSLKEIVGDAWIKN